ncbi:MAG: hypothetical protein ACXWXL_17450 [Candidatus Binatia bacterium]
MAEVNRGKIWQLNFPRPKQRDLSSAELPYISINQFPRVLPDFNSFTVMREFRTSQIINNLATRITRG